MLETKHLQIGALIAYLFAGLNIFFCTQGIIVAVEPYIAAGLVLSVIAGSVKEESK